MSDDRPIISDIEAVERVPNYVARPNPAPIPTPNIFDEPLVGMCINAEWAAHFRGAFDILDQPDAWLGTDEEIFLARMQVTEALLMFMGACNMCCDEEVAALQELVALNTTIVTNLTTIITNQTTEITNNQTIIDQNNTQIYNQYTQQYNDYVANNTIQQQYNNMLYDGTPQSLAPSVGADFSDGSGSAEAILCAAIKSWIAQQMYTYGSQANMVTTGTGIAAGVILGLGAALGVLTGGASIIAGAAISASILAGATVWNNILNDQLAQRKVRCCMYDALKGQPITESNFQHAFDDYCGFEQGSNEALLAQQLSNSTTYYHDDYLAFLRHMQASTSAQGDGSDCDCSCDNDINLYDIDGTGCTITYLGECIWRIVQNATTPDGGNPHYHASVADREGRCIIFHEVAGFEDQSDDGFAAGTGCCGSTDFSGPVGGFADVFVTRVHWTHKQADRPAIDSRYYVKLVDPDTCTEIP